MTGLSVVLVLSAALAHATWNFLAKRAGGGAVFVWLYAATSTFLWAPITLPTFIRVWHKLTVIDWIFLIGSGLIHMTYFLVLQKAYRIGEFSLIYPLARGTGPVLSTVAAVVFIGERPTATALCGAMLVATSLFLFSNPTRNTGANQKQAVLLALVTGLLIALYTLWDKRAVALYVIPPLLMEWVTSLTRLFLLLPLALKNWSTVIEDWRTRYKYAIWIGALNPLAYLLILIAMRSTPVSYVAPAREVSILFGTLMGGHLLGEGDRRRRITAGSVMVTGIILLSID